MAGPGGKEVGRVSVRVTPDTSKFARELRRELNAIEKSNSVEIDVEADTKGVRQEIAAAARDTDAKVRVRVDESRFRQDLQRQVRQTPVGMTPVVSARAARQLAAQLNRDLKKHEIPITIRTHDVLRNAGRVYQTVAGFSSNFNRGELARRRELGEKVRGELQKTVTDTGRVFDDLSKQVNAAFKDARKEADSRLFVQVGRMAGQGFLRGFFRTRIDRSIFERLGFMIGRGFSTPVTMLTRFVAMAGLATAALGPLMGALSPVVSGVFALSNALASASGALLAVPAMAGALAASVAVLAVGFKGMGTAIQNLDNAAKFEAALEGMTPAARGAARALKALNPAFREIREVTQERLFDGIATQVKGMERTLLPSLRRGMRALAAGLNAQMSEVFGRINTRAFGADLEASFRNFGKAAAAAAPAMGNLVDLFGQLARVGSTLLPEMGASLSGITSDWLASIKAQRRSGELLAKMRKGFETIKSLGRTIQGAFLSLGNILEIAEKSGLGLLSNMERITWEVKRFTESASGRRQIGTIFDSMKRAGDALLPVLKALGRGVVTIAPALASITEAVAPALAKLVDAFTKTFAKIGPKVGDSLGKIADSIADILPTLLELLPPFLELVNAVLKPMAPLVKVIAPALGALASAFASLLSAGGGLGGLLTGIGLGLLVIRKRIFGLPGLFTGLGKSIRGMKAPAAGVGAVATSTGRLGKAGRVLKTVAKRFLLVGAALELLDAEVADGKTLLDIMKGSWSALAAAVTGNEEALANLRKEYGPAAKEMAEGITDAIPSTAMVKRRMAETEQAMTGFVRSLPQSIAAGAAGSSNIFDSVIKAFGNSAKQATNAWVHGIRTGVYTGMNQARGAASAGIAAIGKTVSSGAAKAANGAAGFGNRLRNVFRQGTGIANSAAKAGMTSIGSTVASGARNAGQRASNMRAPLRSTIRGAMNVAASAARSGMNSVGNGIRSGASRAANQAAGFRSRIVSHFNFSLYGSGQSVVGSFANGMNSMRGSVGSAASGIASLARGFFPFSPAKWGPFSGRGYTLYSGRALVQDFAKGIEAATPHATRAIDRMTSQANGMLQSDWNTHVTSDGFASLDTKVADALSGWSVQIDGNGMARMVNKANKQRGRR